MSCFILKSTICDDNRKAYFLSEFNFDFQNFIGNINARSLSLFFKIDHVNT